MLATVTTTPTGGDAVLAAPSLPTNNLEKQSVSASANINKFLERLANHSTCIPPISGNTTLTVPTTSSILNNTAAGTLQSKALAAAAKKKSANGGSQQTHTRLYQLVFHSVNGIPIPSPVLSKASKLNSSICCSISISLFDLESGRFIGSTWRSPSLIPVVKTLKKGSGADDEDDEENDEVTGTGGKIDDLRAHLVGNKLNVKMKNQGVYFHTLLQSKHIVAVFEVSFAVADALSPNEKPELFSGGWTPIYLFNTKRGGLDVTNPAVLEEDDKADIVRVSPIFSGTPRLLPLVAPSLFEAVSGFPGLAQLPGSSLQYYILPRPDIKHKSLIWKEDTFISTQDALPGLAAITVRSLQSSHGERTTLSQLKVTSPVPLSSFESGFLEDVRDWQAEEFPESTLFDSEGGLLNCRILERRLIVGFHNSFDWTAPPAIINLTAKQDDEEGEGGGEEDDRINELLFSGNVRLQMAKSEGLYLLAGVEYKIAVPVKSGSLASSPSGGLAKFVERLAGGGSEPESGHSWVEKFICVGWGCLDYQDRAFGLDKIVRLNCGNTPNPFAGLIYKKFKRNNVSVSSSSIDSSSNQLALELSFTVQENDDAITGTRGTFLTHSALDSTTPMTPSLPPPNAKPRPSQNAAEDQDEEAIEEIAEVKSGRNEEFTPLPPLPVSSIKPGLSRQERSRLVQAGFETFRDDNGRLPEPVVLKSSNPSHVKSDYSVEAKDSRLNEVTLQFMGITLTDDFKDRSGGILPESLTFSFRFFTFPDMSTERVKMYTGALPPNYQKHSASTNSLYKSNQSLRDSATSAGENREEIWPAILYRIDQDGRPAYDRPAGLSIQFTADSSARKSCANIRYGTTSFPFYMDQKQIHIDVWDGDSLLHLGTACVDMKMALRQGKSAVALDQDVDIVWNEYIDDETGGHLRRSSTASNSSSRQVALSNDARVRSTKLGSLHMKIFNIGRQRNLDGSNAASAPVSKGSSAVVVEDYHADVKYRTSSSHQVNRLPEVDSELKAFLQKSYEERVEAKRIAMDNVDPTEPLTEEGKKLQHVYRAMKKDKIDAPFTWDISDYVKSGPDSFVYKQSRQERQKDLQTIEIFRERYKQKTIQQSLKEQLTTKYTIDASFGQGYFFEYILENPYSIDQVIEVVWDDSDLRLVDSEKEWQYHRKCNGIHQPVEKGHVITKMSASGGRAELFLHAKEKVPVPFCFQNFSTDPAALGSANFASSSGIGIGGGGKANRIMRISEETNQEKRLASRVIPVSFLNSKKNPISFLEVVVNSMSFFLDKSIQMFHCENELVRKVVRFPISASGPSAAMVGSGENGVLSIMTSPTNEKYLKCSNPDVVCSLNSQTHDSKYREISFKYRLGGAPDHANVFFIFYHDPHCTNIHEIWRISLHTIYRLDVNCVFGQTNMASLVLRGRTMTRQVQCFMNLPNIVSLAQSGPFTLAANALTEIPLNLRLEGPLDNHVIANIIDLETKTLISSWYIITHLSMPAITKVFSIKLTRGKPSNKRVSYTNPFLHQKTLVLKTDSPHLMQFKSNVMELKGGETQYIGLKFAPCFNLNHAEILVFLNNEMDKVEECLSIEVSYEMERA